MCCYLLHVPARCVMCVAIQGADGGSAMCERSAFSDSRCVVEGAICPATGTCRRWLDLAAPELGFVKKLAANLESTFPGGSFYCLQVSACSRVISGEYTRSRLQHVGD